MRGDSLCARGLVTDDDLSTRLAVFDEKRLGECGSGEEWIENEPNHVFETRAK
jgi:hypothetical protein